MIQIDDDGAFKTVLRNLDSNEQRVAAARFVEHVLPLCEDERVVQAITIAGNKDASYISLSEALKMAKSSALSSHARYDTEGDWRKQAGYFVARAAVAALSPKDQMPDGVAWHAALSSRLARASEAINSGQDTDAHEREEQYQILAKLITS